MDLHSGSTTLHWCMVGTTLNTAARVAAKASQNQLLISSTTHSLVASAMVGIIVLINIMNRFYINMLLP